jgi:tetrahydrodipicolinate N-succinyltransferase
MAGQHRARARPTRTSRISVQDRLILGSAVVEGKHVGEGAVVSCQMRRVLRSGDRLDRADLNQARTYRP